MTTARRIALALCATVLTTATIGAMAPAANADITWGYSYTKGGGSR
ncbi:MAG: hypothetical protein ACI379_00070 [Nocardioides sp.]